LRKLKSSVVARAVVNDDHLQVGPRRSQRRLDRPPDDAAPIARRDDHRQCQARVRTERFEAHLRSPSLANRTALGRKPRPMPTSASRRRYPHPAGLANHQSPLCSRQIRLEIKTVSSPSRLARLTERHRHRPDHQNHSAAVKAGGGPYSADAAAVTAWSRQAMSRRRGKKCCPGLRRRCDRRNPTCPVSDHRPPARRRPPVPREISG